MLAAIAAAVARKGYARTSVADVIELAGVSRKTFYEQFANKEECFLAAYDAGAELLLERIAAELRGRAPDWFAGARAATARYLRTLAERPDFARTLLVEVLGAGEAALAHRTAVHERFAEEMAAAHAAARRDLPELPDVEPWVFRAAVGAVNELVTDHLLRHGAATLPSLADRIDAIEEALFTRR